MQVNRLNLIFPAGTPAPAATAAASSDALQPDAGKARVPAAGAAGAGTAPSRPATASVVAAPAPPAPTPTPGVTVALGSGQAAAASGVYTRDGMLAGRERVAAGDQTPAEHFVASAVNILRDFDVSKMALGETPVATNTPEPTLPASRFGSLRQAVGKLNVFA